MHREQEKRESSHHNPKAVTGSPVWGFSMTNQPQRPLSPYKVSLCIDGGINPLNLEAKLSWP